MKGTDEELWPAVLRAADKLGILGILLRVIATELPDNPWLSDIVMVDGVDGVVARTRHKCGPDCSMTPDGCLTALKVEEGLSRRRGRPYAVVRLTPVEDLVEIHLKPLL